LLAGIVDALTRTHQLDNTYIVFTSDNGFHLGQHRLPFGKQTPYIIIVSTETLAIITP